MRLLRSRIAPTMARAPDKLVPLGSGAVRTALGLRLPLLVVLLLGLGGTALAQSGAATERKPEPTRKTVQVAPEDTSRPEAAAPVAPAAQAEPAAPARPAAPAQPAPASPAQPPAPAEPDHVSLAPDSLLVQIVTAGSAWLRTASAELAMGGHALADISLVWDWILRTTRNPSTQTAVLDAAWRLAFVLTLAWGAKYLVAYGLSRPRRALAARAEEAVQRRRRERLAAGTAEAEPAIASPGELRFLRRLPLALLRLVLDLIPIAIFAAVGNLLLATPLNSGRTVPIIILAAVNAYVVQHVVMAIGRALVSPDNRALRLFRVSDETAAYVEVWLGRVSAVPIYGMAVLEIARTLGLYTPAYEAAAKVLILVNHLLLAVVVLQCRASLAARIAAPPGAGGPFALARNWLAALWHVLAIFLLLALWFVWAAEIRNGYGLLLRYFGASLAALVVARLAAIAVLGMLDRIFRIKAEQAAQLPFLEARANRYYPLLRRAVSTVINLVTLLAVLQIWGIDALAWFQDGRLGERIANSALVILIAAVAAIATWEVANAWVDRRISDMAMRGEYARSARLRTLLPLLRTGLLTAIILVVGFTALSQLGVNIAPLLAGASIIGVALGFGSQKLVQDIITGMFLLLENTMQVGDWVTVSGLSGTVEALSVRTIRLRAGDGSVHVIPFSAVTTVTNTNKGIGNAAVSVTVAYGEDTDRVGEVLKEIGAELRKDPNFRDSILDDFALWGVDRVDGATATVLGQMKCRDTGRWGVQREFNRRIKKRFEDLGIRIAVPAQAIILSRPPELAPPEPAPMRRRVSAEPTAETHSPPPAALGNTA